jgi:hypothetical protein
LTKASALMAPNFTQCGIDFTNGLANKDPYYLQYEYTGSVQGIYTSSTNNPAFITVEGCRVLCGTDAEYYDWTTASATISTWVLPIIGLIMQAPFESNAFWKTIFAIAHWVGSPISSLSTILWNIKVGSKCAMLVDMGESEPLVLVE